MAKKKALTGVTPAGTFRFPKLTEPDHGTKEYPKKTPEYNVQMLMDREEAKAFEEKYQHTYDEAIAEAEQKFAELPIATRKKLKNVTPNPFITEVYDKETEEPTGDWVVKFKTQAVTKAGQSKTVPIFDAKGKPMKGVKAIWGGTLGKISFAVMPYFVSSSGQCGITFYLNAVQVIDLVAPGSGNAAQFGFGEEDGYEYEEETTGQDTPKEAEGTDEAEVDF